MVPYIQPFGGPKYVEVLPEAVLVGVALQELVDKIQLWARGCEGYGLPLVHDMIVVADDEAFPAGTANAEGRDAKQHFELVNRRTVKYRAIERLPLEGSTGRLFNDGKRRIEAEYGDVGV